MMFNSQKHSPKAELSVVAKALLLCGAFLFVISLFLTSLFTSSESIQGYWLLALGWLGFVFFHFAWFANPINLLALLLLRERPIFAFVLSLSAILFASQSFQLSELPIGMNQEVIFVKELGLGFYCWYLSQLFFFFGITADVVSKRVGRVPALDGSF